MAPLAAFTMATVLFAYAVSSPCHFPLAIPLSRQRRALCHVDLETDMGIIIGGLAPPFKLPRLIGYDCEPAPGFWRLWFTHIVGSEQASATRQYQENKNSEPDP